MNIDNGQLKDLADLADLDLLRNGGKFIPVPSNLISKKEIDESQVKLSKKDLLVKLHKLNDLYQKISASREKTKLLKKIMKLKKKIKRLK